jgi:hypothetical protein
MAFQAVVRAMTIKVDGLADFANTMSFNPKFQIFENDLKRGGVDESKAGKCHHLPATLEMTSTEETCRDLSRVCGVHPSQVTITFQLFHDFATAILTNRL